MRRVVLLEVALELEQLALVGHELALAAVLASALLRSRSWSRTRLRERLDLGHRSSRMMSSIAAFVEVGRTGAASAASVMGGFDESHPPGHPPARSAPGATGAGPRSPAADLTVRQVGRMDLTFTEAEEAFRAEARTLARGERAGAAAAVGRHRARASRSTSSGSARSSTRAGRWCRGPRRTAGATPALWEWLIFEEEYYRAGAPAAGHPERDLPARADALRVRHRRSSRTASSRGWPRRGPVVPGLVRARTPAATSPASAAAAVRDDAAGGWRLTGQKTWTTRGAFCTHLFGLFRTDPDAERHRGPHLLPRAARRRRASPCAASAGSTATRASPRSSSTTCSSPTTDVLGGVDEGWAVAMATTGSERGLTLRSPGRFLATADRLRRPRTASAARTRRSRRCATRSSQRLDRRRGVPAADARRPSPA